MAIAQGISNVILHVILLAVAIASIFFLYANIIEQKIVSSQVDNLVSSLTNDIKVFLPDSAKQSIIEAFKNLTPPDMSMEDKEAADNNKKLLKKAALVVGTTFLIGITLVALLSWIFHFSFLDLLKENIVILLVAASVEIIFLSFFAKNFASLDPNTVKLNIIKAFQIYANQS